ncbi:MULTISPECIES: FAD-dependent oxidoreductase [unclassified Mesorhizobium]|uniref:GcvT family protein n=1 Tax=unclassified Mesorhizobium TaxID=325217 RepID=UPI001091906B|nr:MULTISPECIES: FAD-dependent oxidoreductase [unclassified Mesorhizobium]TGQ40540.1 FAD-dependent oxidoreductase [Mesorhizobium sp. M4B.F.Ca.ET.214.01.1.1]TGQ60597.1 FAD-dependent oxidoreductase [Mesorhizobium sp. M4B.F.Ca.ET.211.01.1.1]TGU36465.1 FAD-dependent oxidoreductase [Mesorhizobium sp. M4B.F.Ca.ET.150.01.1.1]TIX17033.1 MAG: FAD-dependent oxidoreductase [Mesorhizobium sp.]
MKSHTQVVVVGGGIGGCSTLYHLTKEGISDCVLVERDELTSGTTWHSAAQVTNFGGTQTMVGLKSHSIRLYKELADDPEYPINYHHATGGIRLASTQDHVDGYRHFISQARGMEVEFEFIDAAECQRRHPLISTQGLLGALWDPLDGDIDPAQLCQALARRARKAGAEIYRFNPVLGVIQKPDHTWIVRTRNGDIHCEAIVNAGGYRCNELGAMMEVEFPVTSMEHQYMLTEPVAELRDLGFRVPLIRCPTDDFYSRQEKQGLLVGFYEQQCKTWGLNGIDPDFSMALCPDDLDRVIDVMEGAFNRLPCLSSVGVHSVVNGPITYTPDGLPLVGRIPGKRNAYCIVGLRAGLGEGGGHGWLLAQIIAHGEACYDTWCIDPRRFSRYANVEYTALKAIEDYQNEFRFHMPHEHRPAGRPAKTTPLTQRLADMNADFGVVNGWERAAFFKPSSSFSENHSFRFNNTFDIVASEVETVRSAVGIMEVSGFNRYEITGQNCVDWLDEIVCSRLNRKEGKVGLCYFLNDQGNVKGEATIANLPGGKIWYGSAAAAEYHDMDWLAARLPTDGSVQITSLTNDYTILVVAGPKSREVLALAAPRTDWSKDGFPWLSVRRTTIGTAEAVAMSVSFSGELAWELHVPNAQLQRAFSAIWEAGADFGIRPFGSYATESMRLEKGYRHWKADLITEYDPFESGLERFVDLRKEFVGKDALMSKQKERPRKRFVSMIIHGALGTAQPGDSIVANDRVIGTVTSAAFGHRISKNLAMGFVDPKFSAIRTKVGVEIVGRVCPATVSDALLYDAENRLVRQ